eukprot:359712-Chlamydomonas_euryale.AAC.4
MPPSSAEETNSLPIALRLAERLRKPATGIFSLWIRLWNIPVGLFYQHRLVHAETCKPPKYGLHNLSCKKGNLLMPEKSILTILILAWCKKTPTRGPESQPYQGAGLDPQGTTEHLRGSKEEHEMELSCKNKCGDAGIVGDSEGGSSHI